MIDLLESSIDRLNELDQLRIRAAQLRNLGKDALRTGAIKWHEELDPRRQPQVPSLATTLRPSGSHTLEDATVLRALLCHRRPDTGSAKTAIETLVESLELLALEDIADIEDDSLPILRAARTLTALAAAPDSALSPTAIYCYYVILRELYSGDAPDWLIGGARGGAGLPACAYVTNECIHALLSLEKSLTHTAEYIEGVVDLLKRRQRPHSFELFADLGEWIEVDDSRARVEFQITSELRKENIALPLSRIGGSGIDEFAASAAADVTAQIKQCIDDLQNATNTIRATNADELDLSRVTATDAQQRIRTRAGHDSALLVLTTALARTNTFEASLRSDEKVPIDEDDVAKAARMAARMAALDNAASFFRYMARDVRGALAPSAEYVSRTIDRELTAAASGTAVWDSGELLFAAISHGYISNRWEEERLRRAAEHASKVISERGRFPIGGAIHLSRRGYNLHVLNVDVVRAFAELLHHTKSAPIEPDVIRRLMRFIDDTAAVGNEGAWVPTEELRSGHPWRSATASTVLALDALNRMLDVRINEEILKHFAVRRPDELDVPQIRELFYPDYGLVASSCDPKLRRRESVAVTLERMRAHVHGVRLPDFSERLFSLILHGPPGTGKTTLVESLAKTCKTVLVEVTPSDLIAGGVDAIERTTRVVLQALSLLTRVVIVFDEFDPVLLQRQDDQKEATAFSFLTPGMLPKLKALHKAAKRRSVAYVLNTNLIGKLDDAAIREGRFDAKVGIYPPDVLSRAGRLATAISDYYVVQNRKEGVEVSPPPQLKERFEHAVLSIRLGPMNTLANRGWFTAPDTLRPRDDVFNYLVEGKPPREVKPEAEPRFSSDKPIALRELHEFVFVDMWDQVAAANTSITSEGGGMHYSQQTVAETLQRRAGEADADETEPINTLKEVLTTAPTYETVVSTAANLRTKPISGQSAAFAPTAELGTSSTELLVSPPELVAPPPKRSQRKRKRTRKPPSES